MYDGRCRDEDGVQDNYDNCIDIANADQLDSDKDRIGNNVTMIFEPSRALFKCHKDISVDQFEWWIIDFAIYFFYKQAMRCHVSRWL